MNFKRQVILCIFSGRVMVDLTEIGGRLSWRHTVVQKSLALNNLGSSCYFPFIFTLISDEPLSISYLPLNQPCGQLVCKRACWPSVDSSVRRGISILCCELCFGILFKTGSCLSSGIVVEEAEQPHHEISVL